MHCCSTLSLQGQQLLLLLALFFVFVLSLLATMSMVRPMGVAAEVHDGTIQAKSFSHRNGEHSVTLSQILVLQHSVHAEWAGS